MRLERLRLARWASILYVLSLFARVAWQAIFYPGSFRYTSYLKDDFYYYALVAEHLVKDHRMSFDGFTFTNGFHPLWLICTAILYAVSWSQAVFVLLVSTACLASAIVTLFLYERIVRRLLADIPARESIAELVAAMATSLYATRLVFLAMETTLVVPLEALFLLLWLERGERLGTGKIVAFNVVAAALVLSRLDAVLLVAPFVAWMVVLAPGRTVRQRALAACAFAAPVLFYVAWNLVETGHFLPVSARVKGLSHGTWLEDLKLRLQIVETLGSLGAAVLAWLFLDKKLRAAVAWIAIYPAVLMFWVCARSDWLIPEWYQYGFGMSLLIAFCGVAATLWRLRRIERYARAASAALALAMAIYVVFRTPHYLKSIDEPDEVYSHARYLADRLGKLPGRFAMADYAGTMAFVTGWPILQLEGLASDSRMVGHLAAQDGLFDVLHEYQIDYLIVSTYSPLAYKDGCTALAIPDGIVGHEGPHTPRMRGRLCAPPLFSRKTPSRFTYVFSLR